MSQADYFLKIDTIDGESIDEKHPNEIEILSFSFGVTQTGSMAYGTGGGTGKINMQDFCFVKKVDKATSVLLKNCALGKHLATAVLSCRKPTGEGGQQDYLKITFSDVMISSMQTGGSSGDPIPTESISLNFTKIEYEYKAQQKDGSLGGPVKGGWDTKLNQAT